CAAALLLGGCSEKPPGTILVWRFSEHLAARRAALTSVVAPPGQPVVATGFIRPEGTLTTFPIAYTRQASAWIGSGASEVTRFVGVANNGATGIALTLADGAWSRDTLPAPTADLDRPWSLNAIVHRPDGGWLALGGRTDAPGGSV